MSLLVDDMILYVENPNYATGKLLELFNEFGNISGYKLLNKSFSFTYTNNKETKEKIAFTIISKNIYILGNKHTQGDNCFMFLKLWNTDETKDSINKWKDISHFYGKINIVFSFLKVLLKYGWFIMW